MESGRFLSESNKLNLPHNIVFVMHNFYSI